MDKTPLYMGQEIMFTDTRGRLVYGIISGTTRIGRWYCLNAIFEDTETAYTFSYDNAIPYEEEICDG
jgi:hypothetical protein